MLRDISALTYLNKLKKLLLNSVAYLHESLKLFSFKPCGSLSSIDIIGVKNLANSTLSSCSNPKLGRSMNYRVLKTPLHSMPRLRHLLTELAACSSTSVSYISLRNTLLFWLLYQVTDPGKDSNVQLLSRTAGVMLSRKSSPPASQSALDHWAHSRTRTDARLITPSTIAHPNLSLLIFLCLSMAWYKRSFSFSTRSGSSQSVVQHDWQLLVDHKVRRPCSFQQYVWKTAALFL